MVQLSTVRSFSLFPDALLMWDHRCNVNCPVEINMFNTLSLFIQEGEYKLTPATRTLL